MTTAMSEHPHPLVRLAREAIRAFVEEQRMLEASVDLQADSSLVLPFAGVFVCLKREGELRGCIGTTEPTKATLVEEVISNAIAAASRDPRFPPIQAAELPGLLISVDVLSPPEPVLDLALLDHRRFGVLVRSGTRHGVLLPAIEGVDSVVDQLTLVRQKAGLAPGDAVELFRFEVTRYF